MKVLAFVYSLAGPAPVQDTADVKAAKAEFRKLYTEAAAAADTADVKAAKAEFRKLYAKAAGTYGPEGVSYSYSSTHPTFPYGRLTGEYSYGYSDGLSTKSESKDAYGGTVGSYSYVDANGLTQTVNYVADAAFVYSLAGPAPVQDTADVKTAKAEFRKLYAKAAVAAVAAPDYRKKRSAPLPGTYGPEGVSYSYSSTHPTFPYGRLTGEYSYGYSDGLSTKSESKDAYGGTVGSYSYVDANGLTQTVNYVADAGTYGPEGVSYSYSSTHPTFSYGLLYI
ncbi:cuticle protein 19.8-like [Pollicipes pollicipes]|uniref:cuticle protein 19.8-like n=1 Tax=Pollicipes pollicipes TaxID=41117 RepID=UPI0018851A8A|nr:cuticle protein 19.8-like [Pollicipes pollicipes]